MPQPLTAKQHERIQKKKRKLAALTNLMQLNQNDREAKRRHAEQAREQPASAPKPKEHMEDGGFTLVTNKHKARNRKPTNAGMRDDEPAPKRGRRDEQPLTETNNVSLSLEQLRALRVELDKKKRELANVPNLRLRDFGASAMLSVPHEARTPLLLTDIQHLLMASLIGRQSPWQAERWCAIEKWHMLSHSVVVVLEGLSAYHYLSNESKFPHTNRIFNVKLELIMPAVANAGILDELVQVPIANARCEQLVAEHGSLECALAQRENRLTFVSHFFPMTSEPLTTATEESHPTDRFPRTKLLLSTYQMIDEGYPLQLRGALHKKYQSYVYTQAAYKPVTNKSPIFGVDCEMCRTTIDANELTRICIVNEQCEIVYETLVQPHNRITNYLTEYSGITPELLESATKRLADVQRDVAELLPPDAILVGQSLQADLIAMQMMHPYVIDTSVCFNKTGVRWRKSKLRHLALQFLGKQIQMNDDGHNPVEDAIACVELIKAKLANGFDFGDLVLQNQRAYNERKRAERAAKIDGGLPPPPASNTKRDKCTAIVHVGELQAPLKAVIDDTSRELPANSLRSIRLHELPAINDVVQQVREIALENALTIANVVVNQEDLLAETVEGTIAKMDAMIGELWQSVGRNGLFVVLMGGAAECSNGLAKIALKKNPPNCCNTNQGPEAHAEATPVPTAT